MIKVKGIYNGKTVDLLEPVSIPVDTEVEVVFDYIENGLNKQQKLRLLHERLVAQGSMQRIPIPFERIDAEEPVNLDDESASQWIIRNRR